MRDSTLVKLTEEELFSIAVWSAISGSIITTSDRFHKLSHNRRNLLRFIEPHKQNKLTGLVPFWHKGKEKIVSVRRYEDKQAWAVFIFNTTETAAHYSYSLRELTGTSSAYCFNWKPQHLTAAGQKETLEGDLLPHQAVLYYVSVQKDAPDQNLGLNGEVIVFE